MLIGICRCRPVAVAKIAALGGSSDPRYSPPVQRSLLAPSLVARPFGASLQQFKIAPDDFVATVRFAEPVPATFPRSAFLTSKSKTGKVGIVCATQLMPQYKTDPSLPYDTNVPATAAGFELQAPMPHQLPAVR